MNILEKIIVQKREELLLRKTKTKLEELKASEFFHKKRNSIKASLQKPGASQIIAEFKRQSPSKGLIHADANVEEITCGYFQSGASAISVLTETAFFMGSDEDFAQARKNSEIPLLRKDFMIDEFQFYEAKAMGADVILLIASILSKDQTHEFTALAHSLDMEVLLEVHNAFELEKCWRPEIDLVGVNNRDLTTFEVNLETSFALGAMIPATSLKISESGISNPLTILELKKAGYQGFLMGEIFMKESNPGIALNGFIEEVEILSKEILKS